MHLPYLNLTIACVLKVIKNGNTAAAVRASPKLTEYRIFQRRVCIVNVQLSLHENVIVSVCASIDAAYILFIMWNSISRLEPWLHFRFNISCGVAVTVRSHQKKFQVNS